MHSNWYILVWFLLIAIQSQSHCHPSPSKPNQEGNSTDYEAKPNDAKVPIAEDYPTEDRNPHVSHSLKEETYEAPAHNEKHPYPLEDVVALLISLDNSENGTLAASLNTTSDRVLEATLLHFLDSLAEVPVEKTQVKKEELQDKENTEHYSHSHKQQAVVLPQLQFLEPDLGPAVLPLQVPKGYFVPFVPRKAFGVTNGAARPPHGHASFYRHRPRGLVDVRNSPAFGFLLSGP